MLESLRDQERIIGDMKEENHNCRWKEAVGATCGGAVLQTLIIVLVRELCQTNSQYRCLRRPFKATKEKSEYEMMERRQERI